MKRPAVFAVGLALAGVGTAKALSHSGNDLAAALAASWCGTGGGEPAGLLEMIQAHCWGCGVAPLGAAIMVWAVSPALLAAWRTVADPKGLMALAQS